MIERQIIEYHKGDNLLHIVQEQIQKQSLNRYGVVDVVTGMGGLILIKNAITNEEDVETRFNYLEYKGAKFKLNHLQSFDSTAIEVRNSGGLPLCSYDVLIMVGKIIAAEISIKYDGRV